MAKRKTAKRKSKKKKGPHKFYSKAQWKWAFANKMEWAHRQAHRTPGGPVVRYRRLPKKTSTSKGRRRK